MCFQIKVWNSCAYNGQKKKIDLNWKLLNKHESVNLLSNQIEITRYFVKKKKEKHTPSFEICFELTKWQISWNYTHIQCFSGVQVASTETWKKLDKFYWINKALEKTINSGIWALIVNEKAKCYPTLWLTTVGIPLSKTKKNWRNNTSRIVTVLLLKTILWR